MQKPATASSACAPCRDRGRERRALLASCGVITATVVLWGAVLLGMIRLGAWTTPHQATGSGPHATLAAAPAGPTLDSHRVAMGHALFTESCAKCHGASGMGMPDLGKDLVHSDFVASLDDAAIGAFIHKGRDTSDPLNTTKFAMPPRGAIPSLSADQTGALVCYLRLLQDPRRAPEPIALAVMTDDEKLVAKKMVDAGEDDGYGGLPHAPRVELPPFDLSLIASQRVLGACCNAQTGRCERTRQLACPETTWVPEAACLPNPCVASPMGACCRADGSCFATDADLCPGMFKGARSACEAANCPQPTGACCGADGVCRIASRQSCAAPAEYRGHGTSCQTMQCPAGSQPRAGTR